LGWGEGSGEAGKQRGREAERQRGWEGKKERRSEVGVKEGEAR